MNRMILSVLRILITLIACCGASFAATMPAIEGSVFNSQTMMGLEGESVLLFLDNGDSAFSGDDPLVTSVSTDPGGNYTFDALDQDAGYFVVHDGQVSSLQTPGRIGFTIDEFEVTQSVIANPISGSNSSSMAGPANSILGGVRDLYLQISGGSADGKLRSNPFSLNSNLQIDMASGVTGMGVVTWDGVAGANGFAPQHGLDIDFTNGGLYDGIALRLAVDAAGQGQLLKLLIHSGDGAVSTAELEFPVEADVVPSRVAFVPFESFVGDADVTNVSALQMIIDADRPSLDAQIDVIGLTGMAEVDFAVVPEPAAATILMLAGLVALFTRRRSI